MNVNAILLWVDKENHLFRGIDHRGFGGDAWPRYAIRPTSRLVNCRGTATPTPWGRFFIIGRSYATSTCSLDPIRPTTLWYGIVSTLVVPFTLRTVVALRLCAVTTNLAPSASESLWVRLDVDVEMGRTIGHMPRTLAHVDDLG